MPNFKYTDDENRVYPTLGFAVPGRVIEADEAPDSRWESTSDAVTDPPKAPALLKYGSPYELEDDDSPEQAKPIVPPVPEAPVAEPVPAPEAPASEEAPAS